MAKQQNFSKPGPFTPHENCTVVDHITTLAGIVLKGVSNTRVYLHCDPVPDFIPH